MTVPGFAPAACGQEINVDNINIDIPTYTLTAQAKLLGAAGSWTPADVTGVLTSLSFTVLSGTVDLVDESGTALNNLPAGVTMGWSVSDGDTLTGPVSITADTASSAIVSWTQR